MRSITEHEAFFHIFPATYQLPHEPDPRICEQIIDIISYNPLQWTGAMVVADRVMIGLAGDSRLKGGIPMLDVGALNPDGEACARRINEIHRAFGSPRRISPILGRQAVYRGAAMALECIRAATMHHAHAASLPIPDNIDTQIYCPSTYENPEDIADFRAVGALHAFLRQDKDVRMGVATDMMYLAEEVLAQSSAARAAAVQRGHR